ncbi:hypothetical protein [Endozoicomonas arenosclerae]|uniref:hypothetical protein n=1 Tax=Endozoicomonas arenosclerae TaxID=1633495 RepID=UPI0007847668|nr:hypothetical protein [Endozoicomonas arenosclerae]
MDATGGAGKANGTEDSFRLTRQGAFHGKKGEYSVGGDKKTVEVVEPNASTRRSTSESDSETEYDLPTQLSDRDIRQVRPGSLNIPSITETPAPPLPPRNTPRSPVPDDLPYAVSPISRQPSGSQISNIASASALATGPIYEVIQETLAGLQNNLYAEPDVQRLVVRQLRDGLLQEHSRRAADHEYDDRNTVLREMEEIESRPPPKPITGRQKLESDYLPVSEGRVQEQDPYLAVTDGEVKETDPYLAVTDGEVVETDPYLAVTDGGGEDTSHYLPVTEGQVSSIGISQPSVTDELYMPVLSPDDPNGVNQNTTAPPVISPTINLTSAIPPAINAQINHYLALLNEQGAASDQALQNQATVFAENLYEELQQQTHIISNASTTVQQEPDYESIEPLYDTIPDREELVREEPVQEKPKKKFRDRFFGRASKDR